MKKENLKYCLILSAPHSADYQQLFPYLTVLRRVFRSATAHFAVDVVTKKIVFNNNIFSKSLLLPAAMNGKKW